MIKIKIRSKRYNFSITEFKIYNFIVYLISDKKYDFMLLIFSLIFYFRNFMNYIKFTLVFLVLLR